MKVLEVAIREATVSALEIFVVIATESRRTMAAFHLDLSAYIQSMHTVLLMSRTGMSTRQVLTVVTVAFTVAITISHIKSLNYSNSHIELTTAGWTAW